MHGLRSTLRPLIGPREGVGEVATCEFFPRSWCWGPLRMQGLRNNCALFWASEKVGVRQPLLIFFSRLALGTPENAGVR